MIKPGTMSYLIIISILCACIILVNGFLNIELEGELNPEVSSPSSLLSRTFTETPTTTTTTIDPSIEAIKSDLCEEQPYFIHKLSNFTLSNKTSEKIWRQLVAKPLVKYICKKKKLKLFKRWIFMLGFDTDGDNEVKPDEINDMYDKIKTWKEDRQKRKGKKDKKRKLRHQGHKNIS